MSSTGKTHREGVSFTDEKEMISLVRSLATRRRESMAEVIRSALRIAAPTLTRQAAEMEREREERRELVRAASEHE